ncbi:MAG TPA: hypothetical protein ENK10_09180 [Acidobacteria bacterium]|nr:hypothetical protein [Acidobacteriota bacterium]
MSPARRLGPDDLVLAILPAMVLLRLTGFVAPHEDPRSAVLIAAGAVLLVARARSRRLRSGSAAFWLVLALMIWGAGGLLLTTSPARGGTRLALLTAAALVAASSRTGVGARRWIDGLHRLSVAAGVSVAALFWWHAVFSFSRPEYPVWLFFSPIGHVSPTSDVLAIWLPLLAWSTVDGKQPPVLRVGAGVALAGLGGALLLGASRAALAGVVLAVVTAAVLGRPLRWRPVALLAAAAAGAVGAWAAAPLPLRPLSRVVADFGREPERAGGWLGPRAPLYAATLDVVRAAPVLGHGPGSFPDVYPSRARREPGTGDPLAAPGLFAADPHNALLEQAVEGGVASAVALAAVLALVIAGAWRRARRQAEALRIAAAAALTAALPGLAFSHTLHAPSSLFFFALAAGLGGAGSREEEQRPSARPAPGWWTAAAVALAAALAFWPARHLAAHWELGHGLARLRPAPRQARHRLERALSLDPRCFRAALALVRLDLADGDRDGAVTRLRAVLVYHPDPALDRLLRDAPPG